MADIRIEPRRRSTAWVWILLVLAILAAAAYLLIDSGTIQLG
jgi:hypothetical protein